MRIKLPKRERSVKGKTLPLCRLAFCKAMFRLLYQLISFHFYLINSSSLFDGSLYSFLNEIEVNKGGTYYD